MERVLITTVSSHTINGIGEVSNLYTVYKQRIGAWEERVPGDGLDTIEGITSQMRQLYYMAKNGAEGR